MDSADRAIFPENTSPTTPVARISAGTPLFISSPAALCGTSTKMRRGSVCAMRYMGVVVDLLPAVTRLPTSILRSVMVPSKGAFTCLNSASAVYWSTLDLSRLTCALAAYSCATALW